MGDARHLQSVSVRLGEADTDVLSELQEITGIQSKCDVIRRALRELLTAERRRLVASEAPLPRAANS
jgi:Arc/MetJ-type ribon-helix-helix transcriptional regulator